MQRMTDFCQIVSMSRLFETLGWRVFGCPTLRNLTDKGVAPIRLRPQVPCMGFLRDVAASRHSSNKFGSALDFATLLRFSLFEAVEKSVRYIIRAIFLNGVNTEIRMGVKADKTIDGPALVHFNFHPLTSYLTPLLTPNFNS